MPTSRKHGKKLPGLHSSGKKSGAVRETGERVNPHTPKLAAKRTKSFRLADEQIRRAREILGTTTDADSIEAALDMVVFRQELIDGLDAMAGVDLVTPEAMDAKRG